MQMNETGERFSFSAPSGKEIYIDRVTLIIAGTDYGIHVQIKKNGKNITHNILLGRDYTKLWTISPRIDFETANATSIGTAHYVYRFNPPLKVTPDDTISIHQSDGTSTNYLDFLWHGWIDDIGKTYTIEELLKQNYLETPDRYEFLETTFNNSFYDITWTVPSNEQWVPVYFIAGLNSTTDGTGVLHLLIKGQEVWCNWFGINQITANLDYDDYLNRNNAYSKGWMKLAPFITLNPGETIRIYNDCTPASGSSCILAVQCAVYEV